MVYINSTNKVHWCEFKKEKGADFRAWPFDQPFHLIFNLAVGGNWAGQFGVDETIWPKRMEVDYVRVFQKNK